MSVTIKDAPGAFEATAIVRPVTDSGQLWADDFALAKFRQLPNGNMAVTIQPSFRWMVNRHSNARPVRPVSILDRLLDADLECEVETLVCSDSYCGSVPDSQPGSVPESEADSEPESEVNLEQIWNEYIYTELSVQGTYAPVVGVTPMYWVHVGSIPLSGQFFKIVLVTGSPVLG